MMKVHIGYFCSFGRIAHHGNLELLGAEMICPEEWDRTRIIRPWKLDNSDS